MNFIALVRHFVNSKNIGFTAIEVLIGTALVGLLAGASVPAVRYIRDQSRTQACAANRTVLADSQDNFALFEGRYADTTTELFDFGYVKRDVSCPAGVQYSFNEGAVICPVHDPDASLSIYGNLIRSTRYLNLYDSGALVSKISDLKYLPDYLKGTVTAILASGIRIKTFIGGIANITLPDGTVKTIDNIFGAWKYVKRDVQRSQDHRSFAGDYLAVGYGMAMEGKYNMKYLDYKSHYDPQSRTYAYDSSYNYKGNYSGASLKTDYGWVYEGTYQTRSPFVASSRHTLGTNGSYSGTSSYAGDYAFRYSYGYNKQGTKSQYTAAVDGNYKYTQATDYKYDSRTKIYTSTVKGRYAYEYDYDFGNKDTRLLSKSYTYEGTYARNHQTGATTATYTYTYDNGQKYTYTYSYNPTTNKYEYSFTNETAV